MSSSPTWVAPSSKSSSSSSNSGGGGQKYIGDAYSKGSEQYEKLSPEDKWAVDKKRPAEGGGKVTVMNRDGSDGRTGTPTAGFVKWMKDRGTPEQQAASRAKQYTKNQQTIDNYKKVTNDSNVDGETSEERQSQRRANIQSDMDYSKAVEANRNRDKNREQVDANARTMYERFKSAGYF
jgi:hypothetical protein